MPCGTSDSGGGATNSSLASSEKINDCHPELRKANKRGTSFVSLRPEALPSGVSESHVSLHPEVKSKGVSASHLASQRMDCREKPTVFLEIVHVCNEWKKKCAFTLAEVLITLSILGIVAAVTIPGIYRNYQKSMTINRLKMAYSILDNLSQISYAENGYPFGLSVTNETFDKYFGKYLNVKKYCGSAKSSAQLKDTGCFKPGAYKSSNSSTENVKDDNGNDVMTDMFYTLDGQAQSASVYKPLYWHKVVLKNGMSLATLFSSNNTDLGVMFLVDLDGPNKGPSKLGVDIFEFYYRSTKVKGGKCPGSNLIPGASSINDLDASCNISRAKLKAQCKQNGTYSAQNWNGMGCSGLIIKDGWKISDDYPWDYAHKK